jgi:ammonium transporter, Amt family
LYAEHAIGGMIGLLFNALFADGAVIALDGVNTSIDGGWLNGNWKQIYIQIAYIAATCGYSFVVTALLTKGIDMIPGLSLRNTPEAEVVGMDEIEVCFL